MDDQLKKLFSSVGDEYTHELEELKNSLRLAKVRATPSDQDTKFFIQSLSARINSAKVCSQYMTDNQKAALSQAVSTAGTTAGLR